jgi:cytoskeleton protein RodZ
MRVTDTMDTEAAAGARPARTSAGARLKAAREAAGLSVDVVAQQLKLAPRQVKALEDDDFQRLPGRTFVRGFARNYARFVQLDPDAVLALLPAPDTAPSLERPALATSPRPMGEIPVERLAKPSALRWLIPLLLVAAAAAALYEFSGWDLDALPGMAWLRAARNTVSENTSVPATPPAAPGTLTTALPNPVSESPPASTESKDAASALAAPAAAAAPGADAGIPGAPSSGTASLVLTFKGTSWVEVKDANGRTVVQMTGGAGMTQTVSAVPPLELALGNAPEVDVTFRGQPLDLTPYVRGSVARVALK